MDFMRGYSNKGGEIMVDARILFRANPDKFREAAKGRTFDEFIDYLHKQPNFSVMVYMDLKDKQELYKLAKG